MTLAAMLPRRAGGRTSSGSGAGAGTWGRRQRAHSGGTHHNTPPSKRPRLWSASSPKRRPGTDTDRARWGAQRGLRGASWTPGPGPRSSHRPCPRTRLRPTGAKQTRVRCRAVARGPAGPQGCGSLSGAVLGASPTPILRHDARVVKRGCGVSRVLRVRGCGPGAPDRPDTNDPQSMPRGPRNRPGATPGQPRHAQAINQAPAPRPGAGRFAELRMNLREAPGAPHAPLRRVRPRDRGGDPRAVRGRDPEV